MWYAPVPLEATGTIVTSSCEQLGLVWRTKFLILGTKLRSFPTAVCGPNAEPPLQPWSAILIMILTVQTSSVSPYLFCAWILYNTPHYFYVGCLLRLVFEMPPSKIFLGFGDLYGGFRNRVSQLTLNSQSSQLSPQCPGLAGMCLDIWHSWESSESWDTVKFPATRNYLVWFFFMIGWRLWTWKVKITEIKWVLITPHEGCY